MAQHFEHKFRIGPAWLCPPDDYLELPAPVAGYNLRGEPIVQGYDELTFTWSVLGQFDMGKLEAAYDPANPRTLVTHIDKATGSWSRPRR